MAAPKTLRFSKFVIQIEDPTDPGEWIAPIAFTQKGLEFSAAIATQTIPDEDPDAAPWEEGEVTALSMRLTSSGILALTNLALYRGLFFAAEPFNARVKVDEVLANGGGYYGGKLLLSGFNQTGQFKQKAEVAVSGQGTGAWTWTPAAA